MELGSRLVELESKHFLFWIGFTGLAKQVSHLRTFVLLGLIVMWLSRAKLVAIRRLRSQN